LSILLRRKGDLLLRKWGGAVGVPKALVAGAYVQGGKLFYIKHAAKDGGGDTIKWREESWPPLTTQW